jgi:hypothetical protein
MKPENCSKSMEEENPTKKIIAEKSNLIGNWKRY